MSSLRSVILGDSYRDSIFLMKLSQTAAKESGAEAVSAMMATDRNKDLFTASGLMTPEIAAARANDMAVAIKGDDDAVEKAVAAVKRLLDETPRASADECGGAAPVATLRQALSRNPRLNLALISVAGDYARFEAAQALNAGLDVMLYSDNISLADELALKRLASKKGLLVMGPDCGTAIIDGVPLAFANRVRRGPVGIVAASGTGLQEVFCLLDRMGVGTSQAYGTGGRDLKDDIGGITTFAALDRLVADPSTEAIVIVGKPPGRKTRAAVLEKCRSLGKPVFVHYVGADEYAEEKAAGLTPAGDMTELAVLTAKHFNSASRLCDEAVNSGLPDQIPSGFLCGIFGGGTLAQEAAEICGKLLSSPKASNLTVAGFEKISGGDSFTGHTFWDFGEDEFTVGRPHPMMAPECKMEHLVAALCDPAVSVVLMDMVIGDGSHPDQARLAADAIARANNQSGGASTAKPVIASVCGVQQDTPNRSSQVEILRQAGVIVAVSNAAASRLAAEAVKKGNANA